MVTRLPALLLLLATIPALAVEMTTLYTAQVSVDQNAKDPREAAYKAALSQVVQRVSGSELKADPESIGLLFPSPAAYVVQFRPGADNTLWVSFDGEAIARVLRQAGHSVWGADRPLTLVWLAVDWGQGDREVIGADDPERGMAVTSAVERSRLLRQQILDIAEQRGLPVVFPLLDTEDLQNISFSDIWGGFDQQLLAASRRYDVNSVLVGRIRPLTSQRNRWTYHFGDEERSWNGEAEVVVSQIADLLAAEFAISGSAPLVAIDVTIAGIDSVEAFGTVQHLLAGLAVIESLAIVEVRGDRIHYQVEARGNAERLRRALQFNGLIEQNGFDGARFPVEAANSSLDFYYSAQ